MNTDASAPTPEAATDFAAQTATDPLLATQIEALQAQLAEAQLATAAAKDAQLRAAAEAENRVRRAEREADSSVKFGAEKLLKDLLPVADSLELGIKAAGAGADGVAKALLDGSTMTLRQLLATLEKHGVKPVDPVGAPFDAELHQAMSMAPSAEVPANHVVGVMQKGYTLNGRLLRPALVVVAQAG